MERARSVPWRLGAMRPVDLLAGARTWKLKPWALWVRRPQRLATTTRKDQKDS